MVDPVEVARKLTLRHPEGKVSFRHADQAFAQLNGEPCAVAFAPHKTLLEVLREDLDLTGTKHGCELGECGTCTVLLDGRPVLSCLVLGAGLRRARASRRSKGMAGGAELHPLQQAFADLGAAQCGYCTPGFLLAAQALLEREPQALARTTSSRRSPATSAAAPATSRSTRRWSWRRRGCGARTAEPCTGEAVWLTRGGRWTAAAGTAVRDRRRRRHGRDRKVDAVAKVTGATNFADDLVLPRMLWCKLLRSPHPHARIVAHRHRAGAAALAGRQGGAHRRRPADSVRHPSGQPGRARPVPRPGPLHRRSGGGRGRDDRGDGAPRRCDLIDVEYEPLPAIALGRGRASHTRSRSIHDYGDAGNLHKLVNLEFGDVEAGFAAADLVREDLFFYEGNTHLPMEQHAALADWSADGKVTLWSSHPDPALRAPRARQGARAAAGADPGHRHAQRRRVRRQERPVQPRDRGREARACSPAGR